MATFKIKETGEIKELELIGAATGFCWLNDAVDGDTTIEPYDEDLHGESDYVDEINYICSQETFDWWENYIPKYEEAEQRWVDLQNSISSDIRDEMINAHINLNAEFNDYAAALNNFCEYWEGAGIMGNEKEKCFLEYVCHECEESCELKVRVSVLHPMKCPQCPLGIMTGVKEDDFENPCKWIKVEHHD